MMLQHWNGDLEYEVVTLTLRNKKQVESNQNTPL